MLAKIETNESGESHNAKCCTVRTIFYGEILRQFGFRCGI